MLSESWWKQRFDNVSLENRGSYYEFTGKNEELLIDIREDPERRVRVGTIGSMSKENMEIWLTEQIRVYTESGTMGAIVQESNDQLIENLIEVMMTGFSKTHLVVSMERKIGDKWTPYCGVMAYVSDDDRTLSTVAKSDEIGVGTFWAIKTKKDFVFPKYGDKKSRQFVEMTRLWKKNDDELVKLDLTDREMAWKAMSFLAIGIERACLDSIYPDDVSLVLYDTSTKIQRSLENFFSTETLVPENKVVASKEVSESVLRYHYCDTEKGGMLGKVLVGVNEVGRHSFNAKKYLHKRNIYTKTVFKTNE